MSFGLVTSYSKRRRFGSDSPKRRRFILYLKIYNKQRDDVVLSLTETKRHRFTPLKSQKEELVPHLAEFQNSNLQPSKGGEGV